MQYLQISGNLNNGNQLILEPEDWTENQWNTFLELFDLVEADRIVFSDFKVEVYGTPKMPAG